MISQKTVIFNLWIMRRNINKKGNTASGETESGIKILTGYANVCLLPRGQFEIWF